jgi:hypothetical protein
VTNTGVYQLHILSCVSIVCQKTTPQVTIYKPHTDKESLRRLRAGRHSQVLSGHAGQVWELWYCHPPRLVFLLQHVGTLPLLLVLVVVLCFNIVTSIVVSCLLNVVICGVCLLLPLENLLWVKLRDYVISRVNPNPR